MGCLDYEKVVSANTLVSKNLGLTELLLKTRRPCPQTVRDLQRPKCMRFAGLLHLLRDCVTRDLRAKDRVVDIGNNQHGSCVSLRAAGINNAHEA